MLPLGADKGLRDNGSGRVEVAQRLPPIRVVDGRGIEVAARPEIHGIVDRRVAGVIRVGDTRISTWLIAQLVCAVMMPVLEDRLRGHISDSLGAAEVGRRIGRVEPQPPHQWIEDAGPVAGEEIDRRPVRGETDGRVDVGQGSLGWRPAQSPAEPRAHGAMVVGGPGIEDARLNNRQGAGHHRWAEPGLSDALKCRLVPEEDNAVLRREHVEWNPAERGGGCRQRSPFEGGSARDPSRFVFTHEPDFHPTLPFPIGRGLARTACPDPFTNSCLA